MKKWCEGSTIKRNPNWWYSERVTLTKEMVAIKSYSFMDRQEEEISAQIAVAPKLSETERAAAWFDLYIKATVSPFLVKYSTQARPIPREPPEIKILIIDLTKLFLYYNKNMRKMQGEKKGIYWKIYFKVL